MNRRIVQALPLLAVVVLAACSGRSFGTSIVPQTPLQGQSNGEVPFLTANPVRQLCSTLGDPSRARCFALARTDVMPSVGVTPQFRGEGDSEGCPFQSGSGYCPIDLQEAYDLPSLTAGKGKVVAIVDAYGYKHAAADLAMYRKTMGLSACSVQSKCLRILNQTGGTSLPPEPPASDDWKGEESLDLDMVSAICPNCKIILIQANNDYTSNLYTGVKTAGRLGAKFIGLSWGSGPEGGNNSIFDQPGVVIAAAAGDNGGGGSYGGGPIQPCTYTYVVCVGGTHLVRDQQNKRGWSETVWNDWTFDACGGPCGATGSACSKKISKPSWQTDEQCSMRSAADTAATASLRTPVIVYNSEEGCTPPNCFFDFGGTSASTQIVAGVAALGGNVGNGTGASYIWKHRQGNLYDVTSGNNLDAYLGVNCASAVKYICTARVGFDGPTGLGTPNGIGAF
ncbi:MAG TPA: S8 family serine peptidase [Candidatus Binatia bacterium]|nr:S8 family serine peptidase [Candidatus Binatia bacterium]